MSSRRAGTVGALCAAALVASAAFAGSATTGPSTALIGPSTVPTRVVPVALVAAALVAAVAPKPCAVGAGVTAKQVIVVRSRGSKATVKACRRLANGTYAVSHGPYAGHVGRNGVAASGAKREGDGRTPSGVFKLRSGFGVHANPGVRFAWRHVDGRDVWVDDSRSRYYNLHERTPVAGRWTSAERLKGSPHYDYAQVIGYNEKRVPGRGSAIFLHVDTGRGTAGCVTVPRKALLTLLRWEKPGAVISIRRAAPLFTSSVRNATRADVAHSWRTGCPVAVSRLRVVRLRYWGFDKSVHTGTLVVNRSVATDVRAAFKQLYAKRYPVRRMRTIDAYGGSDTRSMAADNTSAFNCRKAVGGTGWSNHAYGVAIDLNPRENPYVLNGRVLPPQGAPYVSRTSKNRAVIHAGGYVVRIFRSLGFRWGGVWSDPDYQHFDRR